MEKLNRIKELEWRMAMLENVDRWTAEHYERMAKLRAEYKELTKE
jgi:uncharacterized coiled-coil protein SlyX